MWYIYVKVSILVWESFRSKKEERLLSDYSAIKSKSVECCRDGCPSGSFSHLHTESLKLSQSDHQVLGHLSYEGPSPLIAQFGRVASSRKSPGCSKRLPFKNYGDHCALEKKCFALPRSVPQHNPVSELCRQFLQLYGFKIMSNQFNLPQLEHN